MVMRRLAITALVAGLLLVGNSTFAVAGEKGAAKTSSNIDTLRMLDLFGDVFEEVRKEYVEEPDDSKLIEAAINGMLTDLDPHSSYLNAQNFKEMQVQTRGEFGGLGIEVTLKDGLVYVVSPIDETPAHKAGILAGDYITHINDEAVMGMSLRDAVKKMRGKPKTEINLRILRKGEEEPLEKVVIRDIIHIRAVRAKNSSDVGYLRVTSFSEQTDVNLQQELNKIKKELGTDLKGIVLDLRNNPGGLLNQAIAVADMFLDRGEIVSTRGRHPESTRRYNATKGDTINNLPIVVLINNGSASASEIVAGALQDHQRGVVMGEQSFGKGSVQTVIPLPDNSAIRLTTSRYYTPSGSSIQATGITPDIIVEQAKIELVKKSSLRTTEASLPGHLENPDENGKGVKEQDKPKTQKEPKTLKEDAGKKSDSKAANDNGKQEDVPPNELDILVEQDYQLRRAIDLVRGIHIYKNPGATLKTAQGK